MTHNDRTYENRGAYMRITCCPVISDASRDPRVAVVRALEAPVPKHLARAAVLAQAVVVGAERPLLAQVDGHPRVGIAGGVVESANIPSTHA